MQKLNKLIAIIFKFLDVFPLLDQGALSFLQFLDVFPLLGLDA